MNIFIFLRKKTKWNFLVSHQLAGPSTARGSPDGLRVCVQTRVCISWNNNDTTFVNRTRACVVCVCVCVRVCVCACTCCTSGVDRSIGLFTVWWSSRWKYNNLEASPSHLLSKRPSWKKTHLSHQPMIHPPGIRRRVHPLTWQPLLFHFVFSPQ